MDELDGGSGPHSGMGIPFVFVGLLSAGGASLLLTLVGVAFVVYGIVRFRVVQFLDAVSALAGTFLALLPVVLAMSEAGRTSAAV